jgi:NADPH:quinone reductase-like Zn-dependent oxidoreductase
MFQMPSFDPMDLCLNSKTVAGFNLSFFADEHELVQRYFDQILAWVESKKIFIPPVASFKINDIQQAHASIQSGKSVGKIVIEF